jgi:TPR repeat protein
VSFSNRTSSTAANSVLSASISLLIETHPWVVRSGHPRVHVRKIDYPTALRFLIPAAYAGDTNAQYDLALANYLGQGIPVDRRRALAWSWLAVRRGSSNARKQFDEMANGTNGDERAQARRAAEQWRIGHDIVFSVEPPGYGGLSAFNPNAPFAPGY